MTNLLPNKPVEMDAAGFYQVDDYGHRFPLDVEAAEKIQNMRLSGYTEETINGWLEPMHRLLQGLQIR
jgi:hypothetical protein